MDLTPNQKFNSIIKNIDPSNKPNLFLHTCCAPCSCGVFYKLVDYFNIYLIFSNSNINTFLEYNLRLFELKSLEDKLNLSFKIIYSDYNHNDFLDYVSGLENEPEGGKRCKKCFEFRLKHSHQIAIDYIKQNDLSSDKNYLSTTLTVSPHKNSALINSIGEEICSNSIIDFLPSDYKKEDGYYNSIILSKKNHLYRQKYCGCEFSK